MNPRYKNNFLYNNYTTLTKSLQNYYNDVYGDSKII